MQALALLNNKFMVTMAERFAQRVEKMSPDLPGQIDAAYDLALGRAATAEEKKILVDVATRQGLPSACRVILNTNEFSFID